MTIRFESFPGDELVLKSLEQEASGIELLSVVRVQDADGGTSREQACVFVPEGKEAIFLKKFEAFASEETKTGKPKNQPFVQRIAAIGLATLRALWTDTAETYPDVDDRIWWELWLRRSDGDEVERFMAYAAHAGVRIAKDRLVFPDRVVVLVRGSARRLAASVDLLGDLAEARLAKEAATFFAELAPHEEAEWVADLARRVSGPSGDAPTVALLDTGVTRAHPLLEQHLATSDLHTCDPDWAVDDRDGHGTEMAGTALYGDLTDLLVGSDDHQLAHGLESVKIIPRSGYEGTEPNLYGTVTATATSLVEIERPNSKRSFLLAITATDARDRGLPTSWSAAVDALAAGRSFVQSDQALVYLDDDAEEGEPHEDAERDAADAAGSPQTRLFVIAAGNVPGFELEVDHLERSEREVVHDPAHAWNALTVGAFTEKDRIEEADYEGWSPLAARGDLSPYSSTSVGFGTSWPLKPDVVMEGGNVARDPAGRLDDGVPSLSLLTTNFRPAERSLACTWATSAAAAQVARFAAIVQATYPDFWPETVRALLIHSARWTAPMRASLPKNQLKRDVERLVRMYGFGVPDITRATRSAKSALTLVAQSTIRPFEGGKFREMHLHDLPWPTDQLVDLGEIVVRLRVTLSYFVEPNPGQRGWRVRHRYRSHGLRFDVRRAHESTAEFCARVNAVSVGRDRSLRIPAGGAPDNWSLGDTARHRGSVHSDVWTGTAADLGARGCIAVSPVTGWWREKPKRDRSARGVRYALVVSIETDATDIDVDIWTPVAQQVGIPVDIET